MNAAPNSADRLRLRRTWFAACREAGLDDEDRKAIQVAACGHASAADMQIRDFNACLMHIKAKGLWKPSAKGPKRAGARPQAADPQSAKIRALWLALYHLGEVTAPEESALARFVARQTGVDALQFLTIAQGRKVIEILKRWCRRVGYEPATEAMTSKRRLLVAQWLRLAAAGAVSAPGVDALGAWLATTSLAPHATTPNATALDGMDDGQLDRAAERLGAWVRRVKEEA